MSAATALTCSACHAANRPTRGYCRACGASLQPVCRGCRFINERQDVYCGGCGSPLSHERAAGPSPMANAERSPDGPALELQELAELLRPLAAPSPSGELPSSGITQHDLDRLFSGPA